MYGFFFIFLWHKPLLVTAEGLAWHPHAYHSFGMVSGSVPLSPCPSNITPFEKHIGQANFVFKSGEHAVHSCRIMHMMSIYVAVMLPLSGAYAVHMSYVAACARHIPAHHTLLHWLQACKWTWLADFSFRNAIVYVQTMQPALFFFVFARTGKTRCLHGFEPTFHKFAVHWHIMFCMCRSELVDVWICSNAGSTQGMNLVSIHTMRKNSYHPGGWKEGVKSVERPREKNYGIANSITNCWLPIVWTPA